MASDTRSRSNAVDDAATAMHDSRDRLLALTRDEAPEIRLSALEALNDSRDKKVVARILEATTDPHELVRVTALELLGYWAHYDAEFERIAVNCLSDESPLVRANAAVSLALMGATDAIAAIKQRLDGAEEEEQLRLDFALAKLGVHEHAFPFLNGIFAEFYRIRCATANLVEFLITPENCAFIRNILQCALERETAEAPRSDLKYAIECVDRFAEPTRVTNA